MEGADSTGDVLSIKIWRRCTRITNDPGVVAKIAPPVLHPIYFERPLDIGLVRELPLVCKSSRGLKFWVPLKNHKLTALLYIADRTKSSDNTTNASHPFGYP